MFMKISEGIICNRTRINVRPSRQGRALQYILRGAALTAAICICSAGLTGCGRGKDDKSLDEAGKEQTSKEQEQNMDVAEDAVDLEQELDGYEPLKKEYNFYLTYKTVHPWWDAVALGIEGAAKQYEEMGIIINYEYLAPSGVSAQDQVQRLIDASSGNYDVIGVDVADAEVVTPVINELIDKGEKVMTFSSSDASEEDGCNRIAYVGNTHNYEDGADLAEVLCGKLGGSGKIAVLVGTKGAPCHEERALGVQEVIGRYPDMEIVGIAYDEDDVEKAHELAREFLTRHEDLAGIICCNMSNPVGAAKAVVEEGREEEIVIVGMDHDQEALHYLKDNVIYALGVQDCYSIGFDTVQVAVKIADGLLPGEIYPEKTEETTTIIYQDDAAAMLRALYGEIE